MNFSLPHIPERTPKPRNTGITMMMDKGLGLLAVQNFVENASHLTDLVKLGFGTAFITNNLERKLSIYRDAGIKPYFGGTLFEAFIARKKFDDYQKLLDRYKLEITEVSDGSIVIPHDEKCEYIRKLARNYIVLSEVGSKEEGIMIHPKLWISMMKKELSAGSWKVIAEARESGNVGIYRSSGHAHTVLVNKILSKIKPENILWESPQKAQQAWFIKLLGANVNLGNIAPEEVIPLETLRLGLRSDTFFHFLPNKS